MKTLMGCTLAAVLLAADATGQVGAVETSLAARAVTSWSLESQPPIRNWIHYGNYRTYPAAERDARRLRSEGYLTNIRYKDGSWELWYGRHV